MVVPPSVFYGMGKSFCLPVGVKTVRTTSTVISTEKGEITSKTDSWQDIHTTSSASALDPQVLRVGASRTKGLPPTRFNNLSMGSKCRGGHSARKNTVPPRYTHVLQAPVQACTICSHNAGYFHPVSEVYIIAHFHAVVPSLKGDS